MRRKLNIIFVLTAMLLLIPESTFAASTSMPWEGPLEKVLDSLSGPTAKIIGTIAIVMTGLGLAFGEMGGAARKMLQIVFGLSIAFFAASIVSQHIFGFSAGALF